MPVPEGRLWDGGPQSPRARPEAVCPVRCYRLRTPYRVDTRYGRGGVRRFTRLFFTLRRPSYSVVALLSPRSPIIRKGAGLGGGCGARLIRFHRAAPGSSRCTIRNRLDEEMPLVRARGRPTRVTLVSGRRGTATERGSDAGGHMESRAATDRLGQPPRKSLAVRSRRICDVSVE